MDKPDFFKFLDFHDSRFRGVKAWVGENKETAEAWYQAIRQLSLSEATTASQTIFERDDLQPRGYHGHPAVLRRIGLSVRIPAGGESTRDWSSPRYACPNCEDTGGFHVWADPAFEYVEEHGELPSDLCYHTKMSLHVRCTCDAKVLLSRKLPVFGHNMIRWSPNNLDPLIESVAAGQRRWFTKKLQQRDSVDELVVKSPPENYDDNGRYIHKDPRMSRMSDAFMNG